MSASDVKIRDIGGGLMLYATDEYDRLVEFFVKNQLEFDGDEEVDTDIVRCYKVTDAGDRLIGGAVLALREGKFIIDGIAVDSAYRKEKIGEKMLEQVLSEVRSRGGQSLYLVARDFSVKTASALLPLTARLISLSANTVLSTWSAAIRRS